MKDIIFILAWIVFLLMATLIPAILTANNRYKYKCSPDTVYTEVYKQKSDWELLKTAIIWQESKGNPKAIGGNGYGLYQITPIYIKECNRILGYDKYKHIDAFVGSIANDMFEIVQGKHNPEKNIKKAIKLHNPTAGDWYYNSIMNYFNLLKYNQNDRNDRERF